VACHCTFPDCPSLLPSYPSSSFALQFAVAIGATVILTSSSDDKLEVGKKYGAKYTINYKKTPDWEKEVMSITGGVGVDHVVEVGGPGTFPKSLEATRFGGWIHVIGVLDLVGLAIHSRSE
jgi:NADPH:quinone reductase-like Zn-dependent oxidoreductase